VNQDFLIRKMTGRDLDEIMQIELQSFTLPWSRQSYENELNNRYATYIVADYEGEVAAYGGMWVVVEEAHITNVAVAPRYRRQGMGSRLLQALLNIARQKRVCRVYLDLAAMRLYSAQGFIPTGVRRQYYSDNDEDAIVMMKQLQPS